MAAYSFLEHLKLPEALKTLSDEQRNLLCREIRVKLMETVSENGGHLASNLGVVELTVALHTIFDLPRDKIVWDVGHQCYTHKILTGRLERFSTLRKQDGISGFPRPSENSCDSFISGHASTSISAAFGLAKAMSITDDPHTVIAVVGDGALTGGMIYEALNNAGRSKDHIIVVLNDNDMSISKSVGSFARYLAAKRASNGYLAVKGRVKDTLLKIPIVGNKVHNALVTSKTAFRQMIYHSNLFEDFGFDYLGPVDGHDIPMLLQTLRHAKALNKPVVVHVNTVKGKGYTHAEKNPSQFHGVGKFDVRSGKMKSERVETFSSIFGNRLTELARCDKRICAITAAMQSGTGLQPFANEFFEQNRFFDVGIAEEHAVTFACGLAAGGLLPVFAVYSTFLQRTYDQLIHDAAIEPQHIVLGIDRAGIIADDGETHQGLFDVALLSQVPGTSIYSPATFKELIWSLDMSLYHESGISAIRYPKGTELSFENDELSEFLHIRNDGEILVVVYGREFEQVVRAAEILHDIGREIDVLKLTKIMPIPCQSIKIARRYRGVLFVEEGVLTGGIGEHFLMELSRVQYRGITSISAVENPFLPAMPLETALKKCGLDAQSLTDKLSKLFF